MERRTFGKTGMQVSPLGFGGAEIGFEKAEPDTVARLLSSALDAGLNVIDTAECYGDSEELIGQAVFHRRNDYYLFTKVGHNGDEFGLQAWDPKLLELSIDRSLRRLGTDRLDLVQLHSCSEEELRKGDVIDVLRRARDAGKTRFIGYSGDDQAAHFAVQSGAFDTLQTSINIADQQALDLTLPIARERNMGVIAKRPIANAVFRHSSLPENSYVQPYWERLEKLKYDFLGRSIDEITGIALRFTLSQPGVHVAIVGTKNPSRWQENAKLAASGPLPENVIEVIRARWREVAEADWVGQV